MNAKEKNADIIVTRARDTIIDGARALGLCLLDYTAENLADITGLNKGNIEYHLEDEKFNQTCFYMFWKNRNFSLFDADYDADWGQFDAVRLLKGADWYSENAVKLAKAWRENHSVHFE